MNSLDEITIIYKKSENQKDKDENEDNIKLFGEEFVENNKLNCKIISKGKELELVEYIGINKIELKQDKTFEIKLKGIKNITNISDIFCKCPSLLSLPDINQIDTSNITNMKDMFLECTSLISLPDISNWNVSNVIRMDGLFASCNSLLTLPDISKWDTSNVENMYKIFSYCSSLSSFLIYQIGIYLKLKISMRYLVDANH